MPQKKYLHTLIIGGTGMLSPALQYLADTSTTVTSIARHPTAVSPNVTPVSVDYTDPTALKTALTHHAPYDLALIWIHNSAPSAPDHVAKTLDAQGSPSRLIHVLGSASADPATWQDGQTTRFTQYAHIHYQRVILGFVAQNGRSRWLTHQEISDGAIRAINSGDEVTIVGQIRPWDKRP